MRKEFDGVVIEKQQVICDAVSCHNLNIKGVGEFRSEVEADFIDVAGDLTINKLYFREKFFG